MNNKTNILNATNQLFLTLVSLSCLFLAIGSLTITVQLSVLETDGDKNITICTKDFCPKAEPVAAPDLDTLCKTQDCAKVGGDSGVATNIKYCVGGDCPEVGTDSVKVANPGLCDGDCPRPKSSNKVNQSQSVNPIKAENFEKSNSNSVVSNPFKSFVGGFKFFGFLLISIFLISSVFSWFLKRKLSYILFGITAGLIIIYFESGSINNVIYRS
jgi:hypothetical protein